MKRLSALEFYQKRGLLDYGDKRWSSDDRILVSKRLYCDFYRAGISDVKAIDYSAVKVDGNAGSRESRLIFLDRFNKAIRVLDEHQFDVVSKVVLQNQKLKPEGSERIKAHKMYLDMHVLCWGLDRLISHYLGKKKGVKNGKR